jgi:DnaB-like helicase C terminal domain/Primase C terminal 1 (PriCT-1)
MNVELVEHDVKNRGKIVPITNIKTTPCNHERYISLFPFDKDIFDYVKTNGSVKDYVGKQYCPIFFVDIDNEENVESSRRSAIELINRFVSEYHVNISDIYIYFSGNKGFHVGLPDWLIGIPRTPQTNISDHCRAFITKMKDGLNDIDMSVYNSTRIFRVVNSVNKKSGLYKIPISWDELNSDIDSIKLLAKEPRVDFIRTQTQKQISVELSSLWEFCEVQETNTPANFEDGILSSLKKGNRNNTLYSQSAKLVKMGMSKQQVFDFIYSVNLRLDDPLPEAEVRTTVDSAYRKFSSSKKELVIKTFAECIPDWLSDIQEENNKISLKFPLLDYEMKGKLRGELCAIIHYGGTKKSLFAQNVCHHNIMYNNQRVIYSSMEMGSAKLSSRFIDMQVEGEGRNATIEMEEMEKTNPDLVRSILNEHVSPQYGDKLLVTFNSSLDCNDYRYFLDKVIGEIGPVDIIVVDGLSMMGGNDNETSLVNKHTRELKEIAKDYNVFVMMIVHTSRGEKKHTRDVSTHARGSEKIIDNCDFYICPSLIVESVNGEEYEYEQGRGFIRLVNKRGSGKTIDLVYSFNQTMLLMSQSCDDPRMADRNINYSKSDVL